MNGPSFQDIEAMRRLRQIIDGNVSSLSQQSNPTVIENRSTATGRPDVDAMSEILKKFHSATGEVAERLVEDSHYSSEVKEALQTKATATGAVIGKWEVKIRMSESENTARKIYDVINPVTYEVMCEGLVIFEAAHAIMKYLNKGLNLSNNKIVTVLDLEETYNRNRMDAVRFKHRYQRCQQLKETQAGEIFASRFQVARTNAVIAQDQIKSILESIR